MATHKRFISPRAKRLAEAEGISLSELEGTGPGGRVMESDVKKQLEARDSSDLVSSDDLQTTAHTTGAPTPIDSGIGGRVLGGGIQTEAGDLTISKMRPDDKVTDEPITGIRKIIAGRMLASIQSTAQLTLNTSAPAAGLLNLKEKLKASPEEYKLTNVTLNSIILYVTARTLPDFEEVNALYTGEKLRHYENVHLAFAVETFKGLIVPVIRDAQRLSLKEISDEAQRLVEACMKGKVNSEELTGGTFTVTNLSSFGIEHFTPVLNTPQVAILGIGGVNLKPVEGDSGVEFRPHIALSLTIDHQVVDGAPAARFLQALCRGLADIESTLAL
jgi:pyruvate dehydrogenase E2 component (dihydrolipoamide acetyltransferase)